MSLQIETEQEAYLAIMYACISADERVTEEETDELIRSLIREPLFEEANLINLYKKIQLINQAIRFDAFQLIEMAAPKISEARKVAVLNAASKLLQADGIVLATEKGLLQHLQVCLYPDSSSTRIN